MEENNKSVIEEHNASFDEDPIIDSSELSEEELQDTILEDSDMTGFQRFIAKLDDKKWTLYQRILGVILGVGTGLALFGENLFKGSNEAMGSYSLIIAVVIAMLIPNIIEKRVGRKIHTARMTMAITLLVVLIAFFVYAGINNGFSFFNK